MPRLTPIRTGDEHDPAVKPSTHAAVFPCCWSKCGTASAGPLGERDPKIIASAIGGITLSV